MTFIYVNPVGSGGNDASSPRVFSPRTCGGIESICQIWQIVNASVTALAVVSPSLTIADRSSRSSPATTRRASACLCSPTTAAPLFPGEIEESKLPSRTLLSRSECIIYRATRKRPACYSSGKPTWKRCSGLAPGPGFRQAFRWSSRHTLSSPDPASSAMFARGAASRSAVRHQRPHSTLRTPALLAQQLSTMSRLTERPFSFGVGTGWLRDTYDAPGMPFEQRGSTATSW